MNPNCLHIRWQNLLCIFFLAFSASGAASAQQLEGPTGGQFYDGVYTPTANSPFTLDPEMLHPTGYRVDERDIQAPFVISKEARAIFSANAHYRTRMPISTPMAFAPIVRKIYKYITDVDKKRSVAVLDRNGKNVLDKNGKPMLRPVNFEKENGITNWALSIKITRLAFCFSTEPKGVAAQIYEESSFNRNKPSGTGAVGFTQMTGLAIDEVNDQLGNRGTTGAKLTNIPYLAQAVHCYTGGRRFGPMFMTHVIPRGEQVQDDSKLRARAKAWLMADIDRDLIYGQILLKVLLADAHDAGVTGEAAYIRAFKMYNGDPRQKAKYAREIISNMKKI